MTELIKMLTDEDLLKIDSYIENYGGNSGYSMGGKSCDLAHLLRFWNDNKEDLFRVFGNKFIVKKDIDIEYPRSLLAEAMEDVLFTPNLPFVKNFWRWVDMARLYDLDYVMYSDITSLLSIEALTTNIYSGDNHLLHFDDNKLFLNKGCKVMKFLAKMAEAYCIEGFEEFRIAHSRVLNQKRFQGTLCVSIHPLDYMTMSDNDCNWDSCMSWQKPGEYRMGTIETMNSKNIIVAYLKSNDDMKISAEHTWNNKRWRELFIVQPELVTGIKGYPYCDKMLEDEVFTILLGLQQENMKEWEWDSTPTTISNSEALPLQNGCPLRLYIHHNIMYNDFSGHHKSYIGKKLYEYANKADVQFNPYYFNISLSGPTICMCCGEDWTHRYQDFNTEYVMCPNCAGEYTCQECGEYICSDDLVYFSDDEDAIICRWCAERVGNICQGCMDWQFDCHMNDIYPNHLGEVDIYNPVHLCDWCIENEALDNDIGPIEYKPISRAYYGNRYQVNTRNFSDTGFHFFGWFGDQIVKMREEIASEEEEN